MQADKDWFSELVEHWQLQQLLEFAKCLQWNCVQEWSRCGPVAQYEKKCAPEISRNFTVAVWNRWGKAKDVNF